MKEVKKANIHDGTIKKEDESPEEEGEIKEEEGPNNFSSSEDEIVNIRSEKAQNISLEEERMDDKSNETEKGHNVTLKEVKKVNIHDRTEKQEDESPEVEGEIKEEGGLKVEFFPYVYKKKQFSENNEEEKSDKSKFGYINKNGVFGVKLV